MDPHPDLPLALLDIGMLELFVLALAAIMMFGGDLPDVARKAGRMLGRLRTLADNLKRQIDVPDEARDVGKILKHEARLMDQQAHGIDPAAEDREERRRRWREELQHEEPQGHTPAEPEDSGEDEQDDDAGDLPDSTEETEQS